MTSKNEKHVMIIGFNDDAFTLIRSIAKNQKSRYKPVCILDFKEETIGKRLDDVRVVGTIKDVKLFAKRYNVDEIFIAISSAEKAQVRMILQYCKECNCQIKLLPELNELTGGELSVAKLRPVDVADLLGRAQKQVNLDEIMGYIEHKKVLVTGGGGSIGSELCRQIASHNPAQLIILDIYENNAYDIEQELKEKYPRLNLLTLIASVRDKGKMRDVFATYRPQIVFNAAAHKHVPLMETSPNEAVKNNVFGTLNVARAADEYGVETFVQISTDKAVNPTNIMGATKRICEMIVQTLGRHSEKTNFVAVRFGNVLGSNGSVIPLFKKQIEHGGPVTVTHKDIIRYFMTIPEAVSLVLQAGAYAKNGQIFVLDMGEPVKIYDLAYNLIKMSGLEPNVDIQIVCTGLRPGEKLYEERLMAEEGLQKTANGLISIAKPLTIDEENLWTMLDNLYEAAYSETDRMKEW
ncbi:MAG: polysaccharide biosynthesis protein, partial [Clostridia bacterium]|nr:polysaccharide biosynthesis protein [Clostridia bacterium]